MRTDPGARHRGNRTGYRYGIEFLVQTNGESEEVNRLRMMLQTMSSSTSG